MSASLCRTQVLSVACFLVCFLIFIEYKSGTKMFNQDSKILVELGEVLENKKTTLCKKQGVVVFYLLDQVLFIKRSRIGYISNRPAIIAKERRIFEMGLKIEKLEVVPRIGPILLKQLKTALVTTRKSLLSRLTIKISDSKIIE